MANTALVQSFTDFAEKQQVQLIETLAKHYGFDALEAMQTLMITPPQKKRGRPSKKAAVVEESNDMETDLVTELIQSSNDEPKKSPRKGKMTPEEREAKKAETKRRREEKLAAEKEAKRIAREEAKAAKAAEKEAEKLRKQEEKEALKAAKAAEKDSDSDSGASKKRRGRKSTPPANFDQDNQVWQDMTPKERQTWKKAHPIAKKVVEPVSTAASVELVEEPTENVEEEVEEEEVDEEEAEEASVEEFEYDGKTYYRDDSGNVFSKLGDEQEAIGMWNDVTNTIDLFEEDEDEDEEEEEDEDEDVDEEDQENEDEEA